MNLKHLISGILAFFASFVASVFGASESFAVTYQPGDVIENFSYAEDVTFYASYVDIECPAGKVFVDGDWADCPAGYYCTGSGDSVNGCQQLSCPAGKYCPAGVATGTSCPTGTFPDSAEGSDDVGDCYSGTVQPGVYYDTVANKFVAGVSTFDGYYPGGRVYSDFRTTDSGIGNGAVQCPVVAGNQLSTDVDVVALSINECKMSVPAGKYYVVDWSNGDMSVGDCAAGTYNPEHKLAYGDSDSCEPCPEGYTSSVGASQCVLKSGTLKAGYYWNGEAEVECESGNYCPGGMTYEGTGLTGIYSCNNGEYCPGGVSVAATCPSGSYCIAGIKFDCPASYTSDAGATAKNKCYLVTDAGSFVQTAGSGQVQCVSGTYCPGGDKIYYGSIGGDRKCSDVKAADLSWYDVDVLPEGSSTPELCVAEIPAGKYWDKETKTVIECAVDTARSEHSITYGGTDSCVACDDGYTTDGNTGAAACAAVEHNITLNANGGAIVGGSSVIPSTCTVETADITLPTPTKTGYTFGGWYQNSDFSGESVSVIAKGECLSDYTLYAKWTVNTYTISLDANGGTGGTASVTATFGETLPSVTIPTMSGFAFNGYWTAIDGGVQYYNTQGIALKKLDVDSLDTLYAQWVADDTCAPGTYYDSTTGTLQTCPEKSYCPGKESGCVKVECPSEYEYSVAGASSDDQCYKEQKRCECIINEELCPGASCSYNQSISTRFNGVVYKGTTDCVASPDDPDEMYCPVIEAYCLGHAENNNIGQYFNGDLATGSCEICNFEGIYKGERVLFYQSNIQDTSSSNGSAACYATVSLPCTAPICPLKNTGTCDYDSTVAQNGAGFLAYGSEVPRPGPGREEFMCPGTDRVSEASFKCNTGYDKNEDADIDPTDGSASAPEELCTPHVYTFTLNPNGGQTSVGTVYEKYNTGWYSDADATTEIANVVLPTREYYTFLGYFTAPVAGAVQVINAYGAFVEKTPAIAANTTLYAIWQANTYTVQYVAYQATGTMASVEHTADVPKALMPNAFTYIQNNREFVGWARTATATEPEFINNQEVVNLTAQDGGNVMLYPVWKACTACAAGNGATCSLTAPVGVCTYATGCEENYENLQNAGKYNPTCSAIKYAINMETNGGVINSDYTMMTHCTVESGTIVLPTAAQITREDYRFDGWFDNGNFTGSTITSIPAGDCTATKSLYAKWTINVEKCKAGQYYNGTSFVTCPKGHYCPGEGKVTIGVSGCSVVCPDGYDDGVAGISNVTECQIQVPQGSYLATAKGTNMTVCPAGEYTAAAVLVAYGDTSECSSCEAGNYCSGGAKYSCLTETDGVFANSDVGSANINACYTTTVAGKYIVDNTVKTCSVPYYCPGGVKVLYGNSGGNLSCADLSDEIEWKSGIIASGATTPDMCYVQVEAGHYWNGSAFAECKAGTYKTAHTVYYNQTSSCTACPAGYKSDAGASECYLITTKGKYVATAGKGEVDCKAGDFCPGGIKVMISGVGGRMSCPEGYAMSDTGSAAPDQCYTDCAMYSNATQMAGRDYYGAGVDTCEATQCETGFVLANGTCGSCPPNSVCDPNYDDGKPHTCIELTEGKYPLSLENSASINDCYTMTKAGMYVAVAGQGEVNCKVGDYCLGNVKVMYSGTGGNSACATLGAGYSSDVGASAETQCYQRCAMAANATAMSGRDYYGSDATDTCAVASCEAGYTVAGGMCVQCPEDHVCNPAKDNGKPYSCAELTNNVYTRSAAGNSSVDNCYLMTTKGMYVAVAGDGEITCAKNGYCVGGVKVMRAGIGGREACPSGYAKSDAGAVEAEQCYNMCSAVGNAYSMSGRDYYADGTDTCEITLCRAGYTLNNGKCELCPANNVCIPEIDSGKPKLCSDLTRGTHRFSAAGSDDVADCYMECEAYDIVYGTAVPVSETEYYQDVCRYEGKSVTGNPCDIVDGKCVEKTCNYNFEMVNGKCQACARENALSYKQAGGNCVIASCVSGFHPNGQSCEADTEQCVVPNAVSAKRVWDSAKQAFGECVITECEEGYHLGANTCQADEQVCELEHGIGIREWNHKKNTWGDCIATKCDPGYTNDRSQTNELWKQCGRCNNMYSAGGELAASSYVDGCEIVACMYEGELYTLENNECVLICDTYSDETGSRKWNAARKKCERTCEPGYMSW